MSQAQTLLRTFRSGSINLADPDPKLTPQKVLNIYSLNHPHLAAAVVEGPRIEGNRMIYEFKAAPVKTKG